MKAYAVPFEKFVNLADARLGTKIVSVTDDWFADANRLFQPTPAVWKEGVFDDNGKWMDGWESRRKRFEGYDSAVIRLGVPGSIKGVDIDTSFFTGNFPPSASLEAGLDTGPMLLKVKTPITSEDTGGSLHDRLAELGPPAVIEAIAGLAAGTLQGEVQDDSLATYAHKLNKDEARIDWNRPASELERQIRAFNPWPICHTTLKGEAMKVLAASLLPFDAVGKPGEILDRKSVV